MIGWPDVRALPIALTALAVVMACVAAVGWRALVLGPLPTPIPRATAAQESSAPPPDSSEAGRTDLEGLVLQAVVRNPFRIDRRRPPTRYRPPEDRAERTTAAAMPTRVDVTVVGIAVDDTGGGIAALVTADGDRRLLEVGERWRGWRLNALSPGAASLAAADTVITVRLPSPLRPRGSRHD